MGSAELLGSELEESKEQAVQPSWPKKQHFKIVFCIFGLAEPARFGGEKIPGVRLSLTTRSANTLASCIALVSLPVTALPSRLSQSPSQKGACWTSGWGSCPPGWPPGTSHPGGCSEGCRKVRLNPQLVGQNRPPSLIYLLAGCSRGPVYKEINQSIQPSGFPWKPVKFM